MWLQTTGDASDNEIAMDDLGYAYENGTGNSNQLRNVKDFVTVGMSQGFYDGNIAPGVDDYEYDENGNMTVDRNKGITSITYNHLNLPTEIYWEASKKIQYLYNAAGQKLKKTVIDANTIKNVDYLDGFQYAGGVLQFFPHAEGYIKATPQSNTPNGEPTSYTYNYAFNYTDHLGNIRVSYSKDPVTNQLKILEENHYYPFGLKHSAYDTGSKRDFMKGIDPGDPPVRIENVLETEYQYKYNGKEWQDELNLNLYDYHARNYDPAIGRWTTVDPLAEKNNFESPYVFVHNNPLIYVDPDGRDGILVVFPDYKVDTETRLGKQPLGHAGVLLIDNKTGYTRYYEYGRYATTDGTKGKVRNVRVSNVVIDPETGKPTQESLNKVLGQISKASGQNGRIQGAYVEGDFDKMNDYAQGKLNESDPNHPDYDKDREPYSLTGNNCGTFSCDVLKQDPEAKKKAPWIFIPTPDNIAEEYQDNFPKVDYNPETKTTTSDIYKKED